jgi:hypothetical protein
MGIDKELERDLAMSGLAFRELKNLENQPKATFYKPDGTPMPNLPADPHSLKRYLGRGFTLAPPQQTSIRCDVCGRGGFKAKIALAGHMRSHRKENGG